MVDLAALRRDDRNGYRGALSRPSRPAQSQPASVLTLPLSHVEPTTEAAPHGADGRPMELYLLGGFRLVIGGELVQVGMTSQRLLAALACRGRHASRRQIAHILWPDVTSARSHANLRTALYRLCQQSPFAVHASGSYLQLPVGARIDFEHSAAVAKSIVDGDSADPELLSEALRANLYDDLLPDWDDEWLMDHQYRYRQLRLSALETLSHRLADAGQHGAAVQAALAAVQADSLRASAYETLIRACLAQGNRHEAFVHYSTYRRVLREELGLDPPASIVKLLWSA